MASGEQTEYRIFVGLGIVAILLGLFQISAGLSPPTSWTAFSIDIGGVAMITGGIATIGATHHYHRIER